MAIHHCPRCLSLRIVTAVVGTGRRGMCLTCQTRWFEDREDRKNESANGGAKTRKNSKPSA